MILNIICNLRSFFYESSHVIPNINFIQHKETLEYSIPCWISKGSFFGNLRVLNKLIETNEGMQQYNKITHISNEKVNENHTYIPYFRTISSVHIENLK